LGKSKSKTFWSLAGFAFGFTNPTAFLGANATAVWSSGLMGMSLASNIWTALHQSSTNSYNFDATQNTVDSESMIPIIYGTRKFGG